jgi:mono/diheme cytochrome c family protein
LLSVAAAACVALSGFPGGAQAQSQRQPGKVPPSEQQFQPLIRSVAGPNLFRAYCASCHGIDAKGKGPAAPALKAKVPDLTLLAKRNRGLFPEARVRKIIMGDEVLAVHGSREMPVWGPIFHQIERDVDRGNVRLANLVKYLQSIQSPK